MLINKPSGIRPGKIYKCYKRKIAMWTMVIPTNPTEEDLLLADRTFQYDWVVSIPPGDWFMVVKVIGNDYLFGVWEDNIGWLETHEFREESWEDILWLCTEHGEYATVTEWNQ